MADAEPVTPTAPRPAGRVLFTQGWRDVAFLHWAVDPARVAPLLPPGTRPDEHDGATYVGLVPFRMRRIGLLGTPGLPWVGSFLETNVRLYSVDEQGRRGVVFASLDAERLLPVLAARWVAGLPYLAARMRFARVGDVVTYTSDPPVAGTAGRPWRRRPAHRRAADRPTAAGPLPHRPLGPAPERPAGPHRLLAERAPRVAAARGSAPRAGRGPHRRGRG